MAAMLSLAAIVLLTSTLTATGQSTYTVTVDTSSSEYNTDVKFLSIQFNTDIFTLLDDFPVGLERVRNIARGLSPAGMRIGGFMSALLYFKSSDGSSPVSQENIDQWEAKTGTTFWDPDFTSYGGNFNVSESDFYDMMNWAREVGYDVTFNLNHFVWDSNGVWDPYNARQMLAYADSQEFEFEAFMLSNNPNKYDRRFFDYPASQTAADFKSLRQFLDIEFRRYRNAKLYGPDTTSLARFQASNDYLKDFIAAGGAEHIDAFSMHQFYFSKYSASVATFVDQTYFDLVQTSKDMLDEIQKEYGTDLPLIISEHHGATLGGASNYSNAFISGFSFLNQLGMSSKLGIERVYRDEFFGWDNGLIDFRAEIPNPDYWMALVYKRLVAGPVFSATLIPAPSGVNVFVNCARRDVYNFKSGALVIYYMNTNYDSQELDLSQISTSDAYLLWQFTSVGGTDDASLRTNNLRFNGIIPYMNGDDLPDLDPIGQKGGNIVAEAFSYGFVVINNAQVDLCK